MERIYNLRQNLLFIIFIFFLILNFAVAAFSKETDKNNIHTSVWKQNIMENLPVDFCDTSTVFRNCYDVSEQQCLSTSNESVKKCITQFQLPNKINPYGNGIQYAYRIGLCAGKTYDSKLKQHRKETDEKCTYANNN